MLWKHFQIRINQKHLFIPQNTNLEFNNLLSSLFFIVMLKIKSKWSHKKFIVKIFLKFHLNRACKTFSLTDLHLPVFCSTFVFSAWTQQYTERRYFMNKWNKAVDTLRHFKRIQLLKWFFQCYINRDFWLQVSAELCEILHKNSNHFHKILLDSHITCPHPASSCCY